MLGRQAGRTGIIVGFDLEAGLDEVMLDHLSTLLPPPRCDSLAGFLATLRRSIDKADLCCQHMLCHACMP